MTKKELKQIYYINNEIKMWQAELERIEHKSLVKGQQLGLISGSGGTDSKVEALAVERADIKTILEGKLKELQIQRERTIEYIEGIEDSLMRQIVYYRCVSCMSWEEVAKEIAGGNTKDGVRVSYQRFLKK